MALLKLPSPMETARMALACNKKVDCLSELKVEGETYDVTVYSTHILNFRSDSDQLRLVVITLHFSLHFDNSSLF